MVSNLHMWCLNCLFYTVIIYSLSSWDTEPGLAGSPHGPTPPQHPVWSVHQDCLSPPAVENVWGCTAPLWSFILANEFTGSLQSSQSERCPLSVCFNSCCGWRAACMTEQTGFCFFSQYTRGQWGQGWNYLWIFQEWLCHLNVQH